MKTLNPAAITLYMLLLLSCGPSAEERAALEKHKMDSIAKATEEATRQKMETKLALQDSVKNSSETKEMLETQLSEAKGELAAEKDKMGTIKEWQFGRTPAEREDQIKNQTIVIDKLEKGIEDLEDAIKQASDKIRTFSEELKKYE